MCHTQCCGWGTTIYFGCLTQRLLNDSESLQMASDCVFLESYAGAIRPLLDELGFDVNTQGNPLVLPHEWYHKEPGAFLVQHNPNPS